MPKVCSAFNCRNRSDETTNISYYKFPLKDKELTKRWVINMRRDRWFPTPTSYICSTHFLDKYMYKINDQRRLLAKAVPTIFSFPRHLQKNVVVPRPAPRKRILEEMETNTLNESLTAHKSDSVYADHTYCLPSPKKLKELYDKVKAENMILKKQMKKIKQCSVRHKRKIVQLETLLSCLRNRL